MSETAFIINPAAGRGRADRAWRMLVPWLQANLASWEAFYTSQPGEAGEIALAAISRGARRIVAVGGDGTLHELLPALRESVALGIIPAGSGNDFSRSLGIPRHPLAAARLLQLGAARPVDLGMVNGKPFLNVAGVGLDAEVAAAVNMGYRHLSGLPLYLAALAQVLPRYQNVELEISLDGATRRERALLVAVGNARYYGGGLHIVPQAVADDGWLDVCQAGDIPRWQVLSMLPRVMRGTHLSHPLVRTARVREIRIAAPAANEVHVHADGEVVDVLPAVFTVQPSALQVITEGR